MKIDHFKLVFNYLYIFKFILNKNKSIYACLKYWMIEWSLQFFNRKIVYTIICYPSIYNSTRKSNWRIESGKTKKNEGMNWKYKRKRLTYIFLLLKNQFYFKVNCFPQEIILKNLGNYQKHVVYKIKLHLWH